MPALTADTDEDGTPDADKDGIPGDQHTVPAAGTAQVIEAKEPVVTEVKKHKA